MARETYGNSSYWGPTGPYPQHSMNRPNRHSRSPFGRLSVVLLSTFYIALIANGIRLLTEEPYYICLILALALYGARCYFLRRQSFYELSESGGWDKAGYMATALLSVALAAYGLYGLSLEVSEASTAQPSMKYKAHVGNARPGSNSPMSREQLETRIQELEEDLYQLSRYEPTPARDQKIADYEEELRKLKGKLEATLQDLARPVPASPFMNRLNDDFEKSDQQKDEVLAQPTIEPETRSSPSNNEKPGAIATKKPLDLLESGNHFEEFVAATLALATNAMICWSLIIFMEIAILILGRARHFY